MSGPSDHVSPALWGILIATIIMKPSMRLLRSLAAEPKPIGFIGLGRMGSEMAFNLFSKEFTASPRSRFVVCDAISKNASTFCSNFVNQFPGANISIAENPAKVAMDSVGGTIITMLPSTSQVLEVYNHIIPVLETLPPGVRTLCIDSTTLSPGAAKIVAAAITSLSAEMVDAPVSGGVTGAKAGSLSFLVGGSEQAFNASYPLLSMMGQRIIHCGPSGSGLGAKICNNLILGIQQIAVAEGMLLGEKLGLDPKVLTRVISSSTGSCWSMSVNNPVPHALEDKSPPCERDYDGGFATSLMLKDMGLATAVASAPETLCSLPLGREAEKIYAEVIEMQPKLAQKDFSSVYQYLKDIVEKSNV